MNAYQIMNGLQKINVCSSGLIPQLERQHNDNKRIRDLKKKTVRENTSSHYA